MSSGRAPHEFKCVSNSIGIEPQFYPLFPLTKEPDATPLLYTTLPRSTDKRARALLLYTPLRRFIIIITIIITTMIPTVTPPRGHFRRDRT